MEALLFRDRINAIKRRLYMERILLLEGKLSLVLKGVVMMRLISFTNQLDVAIVPFSFVLGHIKLLLADSLRGNLLEVGP